MVWLAGCVVIEGDTDVQMPVSETVCGLLGALSVSVKEPVRVPVAEGVNLTLIVQLAPAAKEVPQVPTPAKAKSPLMAVLSVRVALPVFVTVTNCVLLVVPTG